MSDLSLRADHAWRLDGFAGDVAIAIDGGRFASVAEGSQASPGEHERWVLPGMPNLHSHAFQRAMAGLAERRAHAEDSFWTWREVMYAFAGRIGPDDLKSIAAELYAEMLEAGYTDVCEFHYLHHQPDGTPYADPAAMSVALIEAARETGIGLTLLPTLYMTGGFDGRPLSERQRRFGHDVDGYLRLIERLRAEESSRLRVGIALHSLRAVPEDAMRAVLESGLAEDRPVHIHIAEQIGEVQDCLAIRRARPVEWLLDHAPVDARWCLIHATHMTDEETAAVARSGAVAGLCPTTEANLGDGLFRLAAYLDAGGAIGVGSDSHISVSPVEELRWLEYGQRLGVRRRNIAARAGAGVGESLWSAALAGGARAAGSTIGRIVEGARADLLVLDADSALLAARDAASLIDTFVFAGNTPLVRHVMVDGAWVVRDFRHRDRDALAARYRDTVLRLAR